VLTKEQEYYGDRLASINYLLFESFFFRDEIMGLDEYLDGFRQF
jgi:hypothetical protein